MKILIACLSLMLVWPAFGRSWTNSQGRVIEAELVRLDGDQVVLSMKGKEYKVPLASLSEEDQAFAKEESVRLAEEQKAEAGKFMGQELVAGQVAIFEFNLSEENKLLAQKKPRGWGDQFAQGYGGDWLRELSATPELDSIRVFLGIPSNFDPTKGCPIFVQWASTDGKSHMSGAKHYWKTCDAKGWMLVSVEGAPDAKALWTDSVFLAGIKEFFEQLHAKYPGSEQWKVATGGFSGGSKISQWMGGLMNDLDGVEVSGYWMGGCNEALFPYAFSDLGVSKKSYRGAKVFISSGDKDDLVKASSRENVERGSKDAGFVEVQSKIYEGGHSLSHEHFAEALDWFIQ